MSRRIGLAVMVGVIALASAYGQEINLTLDDVIERGLAQNLSVRVSELDVQNKKAAMDTAYNVFYPDLQLNTTLLRSNSAEEGSLLIPNPTSEVLPGTGIYDQVLLQEYSIDQNILNVSLSGSLAISLAMFDGIEALRSDYAMSLLSYEDAAKRLERDLKKNFYSLILQKEQIGILSASRATMQARYDQTLVDYQNGLVPEIALLNSQVAYENMGPMINDAQRAYDFALSLFKQNLGIDQSTDLILVGEIVVPDFSIDEERLSADRRFDVRTQRNLIELAEIQLDAARHGDFVPSLVLSGSYAPALVDPFNGENWEDLFSEEWSDRWIDGGSLSVTLNVPLDNYLPWSAARVNHRNLENNILALRLQEESIRDLGSVEISNTLDSMDASLRSIEILNLTLRTNERNAALVEEAYLAGSRSQLDVDTAEDELRQAQLNLLNEQFRYLSYLFDLEYLVNSDFSVAP
jgi:outer membrane protein TolC